MACPSKLHLRALYTINSSPQYILARSHSPIPVTPISEQSHHAARQRYATVSLKACLDTICRSSPELIQDNNRDYSVYVLDPLESNSAPAPMSISNSSARNTSMKAHEKKSEQPYGVAVGLGLMSWALHADENDTALVTGTQVRLNTGQDALEIIFALRETVAMQRTSLSSTMRSWGLPLGVSSQSMSSIASLSAATVDPDMLSLTDAASKHRSSPTAATSATDETLAVIQTRNRAKSKARRASKPSMIPATESDKLMYASETYIGPLKKKGRPKNSNNSGKVSKLSVKDNIGARDREIGLQTPDNAHGFVESAGPQTEAKPVTRNSVTRNASIQLEAVSVPEAPQTIRNQDSPVDFLTSILSSGAPSIQNVAVLSKIDSSATTAQTLGEPENNPALIDALRQLLSLYAKQSPQSINPQSCQLLDRFHSSHGATVNTSQDEDIVILDKENVDPLAFRRRVDRDSLNLIDSGLTQSVASSTDHSGHVLSQRNEQTNMGNIRRKRTLSDFMDEKESERNKQREKERSERKERHRHSRVRRTSGSSSVYESNSSGLRHYPRLLAGEPLPRPGMTSYYRIPLETRSSPTRPKANTSSDVLDISSSRQSDVKAPTSSPPRLNPTLALRKRYVLPEWARTNTATQPRLSEEAQRALEEAEERKKKEREAAKRRSSLSLRRTRQSDSNAKQARTKLSSETSKSAPPPLIAADDACPVFATPDTSDDMISALYESTARPSTTPTSSPSPPTPRTPPKLSMPLFTPGNGSGSLFTPTPKTKTARRSGSIGSRPGKSPESPSPSLRGKSVQMSPIQAIVSGRSIEGAGEWNGNTREDNGWDEIDGPPSSLPTASDGEDDLSTSSSFDVETKTLDPQRYMDDQDFSVKQHWIGLPPSSPPPSSPILTQEQDDEDMELPDLPVLTSDIEGNTSPAVHMENKRTAEDMIDPLLSSLSSEGSMSSDMGLFNQLSSANFQNGSNTDALLESILQNGLVDFDFTGFWESFKPMVGDHVSNISDTAKVESGAHSDMSVDHNKLAADVQALFGGCLM
ncbi:hypothetical protein AX15_003220 [Amanita polypyramis BW_CC]|nr:hypothetical protein AX15_003220 [Amanita polypyramis BW_CC]